MHTTTTRELHLLPGGGVLIDSPGIRAVGLIADTDGVAETFVDVDENPNRVAISRTLWTGGGLCTGMQE